MTDYTYQYNYSRNPRASMYDERKRTYKASKTLSVLTDHFTSLESLSLLDIGCSAGIMTRLYATKFHNVVGIDIDDEAVDFAVRNNISDNIQYVVGDGMGTCFDDESFDVVTCSHVYEHVPDAGRLMSEIWRLLKRGGICYFAAGNRLNLIEAHYDLPLLSILPKSVAHVYVRLSKRADFYYESHLTLWGLKRLVSDFQIIDYTKKIVEDPVKYCATEIILPGSFKQKILLKILEVAYWLCPTYIWLLRKE